MGGIRAARLGFWLLSAAVLPACAPPSPSRPDVVLVTVDTLRADHLGCYGYGRPTSPAIDRVCAEAVVFEQALTPTPTTDPGHASILTGLHPSVHGVLRNGWRLAEEHRTLAEGLRDAGYRTQAFVSVGHLSRANGFGQGFDGFGDEIAGKSLTPTQVTQRALDWLGGADEPFFLWVHYWDPHGPYQPPEEHDLFYEGEDWRWLRTFTTGGRVPEGDAAVVQPGSEGRIVSLYDGEVHYTDSELGRLVDALRERGSWDRTLFVLTSDHGEMFDEIAASHGYAFDHGEYLFEPNVRVPLIVKLPGGASAGRRVGVLASTLDVVPTVLEAVGSSAPGVDGVSLLSAAAGGAPGRARLVLQRRADRSEDVPAFHELALRTPRWKYVWDADSDASWLYDLASDPGERSDRSTAAPEPRARLAEALAAWRSRVAPIAWQEVPPEQRAALEALGYVQ